MYNRTHEHKTYFVRLQVSLLPAGIFRVVFDPEIVHQFVDLVSRFSPLWLTRPVARSGARSVDSSSFLGTESRVS